MVAAYKAGGRPGNVHAPPTPRKTGPVQAEVAAAEDCRPRGSWGRTTPVAESTASWCAQLGAKHGGPGCGWGRHCKMGNETMCPGGQHGVPTACPPGAYCFSFGTPRPVLPGALEWGGCPQGREGALPSKLGRPQEVSEWTDTHTLKNLTRGNKNVAQTVCSMSQGCGIQPCRALPKPFLPAEKGLCY